MAERKTFLFFCGWAEVLGDFTPEDRCAIYDAIIAYAENGSLPELSPVLEMAFKFIKKDVDEMQEKYEEICKKRKDAIAKRWEKQRTLKTDTNEYKSIEKNTNDTNVSNEYNEYKTIHSKHEHKHEHEHEHEHKHEHKHEHESRKNNINNILPPPTNKDNISRERVEEEAKILRERIAGLKEDEIWLEAIQKNFGRDNDQIASDLDEFYQDMILRGTQMANPQSVFISWLGRRLYGSKTEAALGSKDSKLGKGEWRDKQGRRRFDKSDIVVPEDAPPRPSEGYYWNEISKRWENFV